MTKYSHTRIGTYENCPLQYRYKYIDDIETPFEQTDSTFLGSRCHEALEKLYRDKIEGKIDTKEEFLQYYDERWEEEYDFNALLHTDEHKSGDYYRRLGRGWIERYYDDFFVNDKMEILGIETDDVLTLPDGNQYYIRIDKFGFMDGTYYVCDYKTDSRPKAQSAADADRQLAMYALWVKRTFPNAKKIKLIWQMLRFTGDEAQVISERTMDQLDDLENSVVSTIYKIENTEEFKPSDTAYCNYCVYKTICPKFAPPKILTMDDATELADEFIKNKAKIKTLEIRNEQIEKDLISIVKENECDIISGTERDLSVSKNKSVEYADKDGLESLIKEKGLYENYLKFDSRSVTKDIINGTADPDIMAVSKVVEKYSFRSKKKIGEKE